MFAGILGSLVIFPAQAESLSPFQLKTTHHPSDLTLLDRQGTPLQSIRTDPTARRLPWVALTDFSPALRTSIVLAEDHRFHAHTGVDWSGLARSTWANLAGDGAKQGASTITMQLAGLIDTDHARPAQGRSVVGKLGQIAAARQLEARWSKAQLLEAYLNRVPMRGELVGIPAASRVLLGKHPSGLDAAESALLAALVRGPDAARGVVVRRACALMRQERVGCAALEPVASGALVPGASARAVQPAPPSDAPHYARHLLRTLKPPFPATLKTTLDAGLQRLAVQALRQQLAELSLRHIEDGAVLVLDNATGEVRAWVGSSGAALSDAAAVDMVLTRRQPGSTLKPFVYAMAFERRLITPASLLEDAPAQLMAGSGVYAPQNYDHDYHGWVSARNALAASLNIPAVRLGVMLTPDALFDRLNAYGLAIRHSGGFHGAALALGSAEVTLFALTNAYRALANGGRTATGQVGTPAAAWLVGDILSDNAARSITFGLDSPLVTRGFAAVKTGTSKDLRDNWCVGWTDRYTVGVWVGNASGAPMQAGSGTVGAAARWRTLGEAPHDGQPSRPPPMPSGVVRQLVAGDAQPARIEHFLTGTEQAEIRRGGHTQAAAQYHGIASPQQGALYAIDPDIPPKVQRIVFEGEPGQWWLDGKRIGQGSRVSWAPWPGRHVLELRLGGGRVETVRFEVRGAVARSRP
ncbi:penicillin-binding protein 1C [Sphaerotilus montanus]|uniref:penicillin-binding protein 1C n=1 Tax=Sphaerotilus montanus TaxID=522889 RepID=UPI003FA2DFB9